MKIRRGVVLLVVIFCAIAFSACSNNSNNGTGQNNSKQSESKGKIIDPTTLITVEEATQILGSPSKQATVTTPPVNPLGQKNVIYAPVDDKVFKLLQLSFVQNEGINPEKVSAGYTVTQLYNDTRKGLADGKDISGLGDKAFVHTSGLYVLKGNIYFVLYMDKVTDPARTETAKTLAGKVLSRL